MARRALNAKHIHDVPTTEIKRFWCVCFFFVCGFKKIEFMMGMSVFQRQNKTIFFMKMCS